MKLKNWILTVGIIYIGYIYFPDPLEIGFESPITFKQGTMVELKLQKADVVDKNGIGNEWFFDSKLSDGREITKEGILVDLSGKERVRIISTAIEEDPSSDDIGYGDITLTPDNLDEFLSDSILVNIVKVYEKYGNGAGNTATCEFRYLITIKNIGTNIVDKYY